MIYGCVKSSVTLLVPLAENGNWIKLDWDLGINLRKFTNQKNNEKREHDNKNEPAATTSTTSSRGA